MLCRGGSETKQLPQEFANKGICIVLKLQAMQLSMSCSKTARRRAYDQLYRSVPSDVRPNLLMYLKNFALFLKKLSVKLCKVQI